MTNDEVSTNGHLWREFSALVLTLTGILALIAGVAALAKKDSFATTTMIYQNLALFGWGLVLIGAIELIVGYLVFKRYSGGRIAGVFVALLNACWWFFFIDVRPVWSIIAVAMNVLIMYGLVHARTAFDKSD